MSPSIDACSSLSFAVLPSIGVRCYKCGEYTDPSVTPCREELTESHLFTCQPGYSCLVRTSEIPYRHDKSGKGGGVEGKDGRQIYRLMRLVYKGRGMTEIGSVECMVILAENRDLRCPNGYSRSLLYKWRKSSRAPFAQQMPLPGPPPQSFLRHWTASCDEMN